MGPLPEMDVKSPTLRLPTTCVPCVCTNIQFLPYAQLYSKGQGLESSIPLSFYRIKVSILIHTAFPCLIVTKAWGMQMATNIESVIIFIFYTLYLPIQDKAKCFFWSWTPWELIFGKVQFEKVDVCRDFCSWILSGLIYLTDPPKCSLSNFKVQ